MTVQTAIVGASGYAGAELAGLLAGHPHTRLAGVYGASSSGERWEDLYPGRAHLFRGEIKPFAAGDLDGLDTVFLALPPGASARTAQSLRGRVGCVIDLSGALRLTDASEYRRWYGEEHPAPELLGEAVYGLPELFGADLVEADLIACAGCYATVAQLAAAPALALGETVSADVHLAASSGTSGAGRKASVPLSFSEVFADLRPYRVGRHQHSPEIAKGLSRHSGRPVRVTFVPQLVPVERGIAASVTLSCDDSVSATALLEVYRQAYAETPFVRVHAPESRMPSVRGVTGTNFCDLAPLVDPAGGSVIVLGAIDNLLKGAAGQAVQVFNLSHGLPETTGLLAARTEDDG